MFFKYLSVGPCQMLFESPSLPQHLPVKLNFLNWPLINHLQKLPFQTIPEEGEPYAPPREVIAHIADGDILGTNGVTDRGTNYVAFRGIPYAQPPVGNLRFAVSLLRAAWLGHRVYTKMCFRLPWRTHHGQDFGMAQKMQMCASRDQERAFEARKTVCMSACMRLRYYFPHFWY